MIWSCNSSDYTCGAKGCYHEVESSGYSAFIGSSGAVKITLLRCINRLIEPDAGTVLLNGTDLTPLTGAALRNARRSIGMSFQSFNLLDRLTVMENVLACLICYASFCMAGSRRNPPCAINRRYAR